MKKRVDCLPEFARVRLICRNKVGIVESFGCQDGFVVEVGSCAEKTKVGR